MKKILTGLLAFAAPVLALPSLRAAFNPAIVPADSQWVVYLNIDQLRQTDIGKELIETALKKKELKLQNSPVQPDIQKILQTIGSATAFGHNFSAKPNEIDSALVLQGTPDLRKIVEGALTEFSVSNPKAVTETKGLPFPVYSVQGTLLIGLPPEPIVIVSKSRESMEKALEVFRGKAPSIKNHPSALDKILPPTASHYLVAASRVPSVDKVIPPNTPPARILQMAQSGSVTIGENGKMTEAGINLNATNDETADKLSKILQGIAAMLSLTQSSDQQLSAFLRSVAVERNNDTVSVHLAYPSAQLATMIRSVIEQKKAPPAAHKTHPKEKPLAEWTADQELGGAGPTPQNFVTKTIQHVRLANGTRVIVGAHRNGGENGRIDYVEITPENGAKPAMPLLFEAEYMNLHHYRVENVPFASGGKVIILTNNEGTASLVFPGAPGLYTIKVRYVDESDGKSTFFLTTKPLEAPPAPPPAPAAPTPAKSE